MLGVPLALPIAIVTFVTGYIPFFGAFFAGAFGTKVSTRPSHPRDSIFFQAGVAGCEKCVTFIGDYIGLDYGRDGKANMAWTDMRRFTTVEGVSGYAQHIVYARR